MIGTIRKHSKVMWWIVIVAIIITFVWWGSNTSQMDTSGGGGNYGVMNGEVITPALFTETAREVNLNYFYSSGGTWPGDGSGIAGFKLEEQVFQRLLLIQKAKELGIHVSDDAVAQAASARMRAVNRGNPVAVTEFETSILAPQRLNFADFERYVRNDLAVQQLISIAGAGGDLVTPQEIETLYRRDFEELSAQVVFFHANTNQALPVTPEKIGEFYTNRLAYYRLPERLQIHYVRFPVSNYLAKAQQELDQLTNLTEIVAARYEQLGGTNYFTEAKSPEEAKGLIREEFLKRSAINETGKEANKFATALYDVEPFTPESFKAVAQKLGLTVQLSVPFGRDEQPAGLDVNADFTRRAFNLTAEDPLTVPLVGDDHVYVIAFHRRLPSENPPFETIRERVTQDYRFMEAAMAAYQAGVDFQAAATNGLAAGKSFAELCAQANVKPTPLAPFSQSTRTLPEIENNLLPNFKRVAFSTPPGQVGPLLPGNDGALVVYIQAKLPVDETAMRTNLPAFTRSVHQVRRNEVFNSWFSREAAQAFSTIPYFQQQQAQMSGAPARP